MYTIKPNELELDLYPSSDDEATRPPSSEEKSNLGRIGLQIKYDYMDRAMIIRVIGCRDLPGKTRRKSGVTDPHVEVTVVFPDQNAKKKKFVTSIKKSTQNPVYDEDFSFKANRHQLLKGDTALIKVKVCDFDRFSRKITVGRAAVRMGEIVDKKDNMVRDFDSGDIWKDIVDKGSGDLNHNNHKGEVLLSLNYNPDTSSIILGIHKLRNLTSLEMDRDISIVYLKITFHEQGETVKTKKSSGRKVGGDLDEYATYKLHDKEMADDFYVTVTVSTSTNYLRSNSSVLGRVRVGCDKKVDGAGLAHWSDALCAPRNTVGQWHNLS